ncbi:MAG: hypothetical protein M1827_001827 [Pycnora praestabilis]|nr:MAG: hypothetical protein M1827_001827 [Pycnora praestabilis]
MDQGMEATIDFCTLGMFIIDEIHFQPPTPPVTGVLGGAGSYSALGARLFSPPPLSKSVGWIVDAGSDFPEEIRDLIRRWDTGCLIRETPERLTTRGWNGYGEDEKRDFRYLTPKLRLDHNALSSSLLLSKSFHLICSPSRCIDLVTNVTASPKQAHSDQVPLRPLFIWEPVPDLCIPKELPNCLEALRHVEVISPNHAELGGFFGYNMTDAGTGGVNRALVQACCDRLVEKGIGGDGKGAVVVRAGKSGCYLAAPGLKRWFPAYHQAETANGDNKKVVDPTGGGNGFLGGLAVGLIRGGSEPGLQNLEEAAAWATVAASFAIEQVGMPTLVQDEDGETWNGVHVQKRLEDFKRRLRYYVQP